MNFSVSPSFTLHTFFPALLFFSMSPAFHFRYFDLFTLHLPLVLFFFYSSPPLYCLPNSPVYTNKITDGKICWDDSGMKVVIDYPCAPFNSFSWDDSRPYSQMTFVSGGLDATLLRNEKQDFEYFIKRDVSNDYISTLFIMMDLLKCYVHQELSRIIWFLI